MTLRSWLGMNSHQETQEQKRLNHGLSVHIFVVNNDSNYWFVLSEGHIMSENWTIMTLQIKLLIIIIFYELDFRLFVS